MTLLKIYWRLKAEFKKLCFKIMFGKRFSVGKNTTFRPGFGIYLEKGATIKIGSNCFFNRGCSINALKNIEIGDNTIFGENVKIYDQNHRFKDKDKLIRDQGYSIDEVKIGKNCWICTNAVILKGVTIGDNSVIGAGCIIYKDVPPNSIVKSSASTSISNI